MLTFWVTFLQSQLVLTSTRRGFGSVWGLPMSVVKQRVWDVHSACLRGKEKEELHPWHRTHSLPLVKEDVTLVTYLLDIIISDFPEVMVTKVLDQHMALACWLPWPASEQSPPYVTWAHLQRHSGCLWYSNPLFSMNLPPDAGSGPTGCPPRYLHTVSKTDPVKSLLVTSPISSGKQN